MTVSWSHELVLLYLISAFTLHNAAIRVFSKLSLRLLLDLLLHLLVIQGCSPLLSILTYVSLPLLISWLLYCIKILLLLKLLLLSSSGRFYFLLDDERLFDEFLQGWVSEDRLVYRDTSCLIYTLLSDDIVDI